MAGPGSLSDIEIVARFRMRPSGKEQEPRNATGVAGTYVEDVSWKATQHVGMQSEPQ